MTDDLSSDAAYDIAQANQRAAANPAHTRLASANAGSGKTRVLVERVSRLLLRKVDPKDILCLTYTKAAASEMQSRLFKTLGKWSVMQDGELKTALKDLYGQPFDQIHPTVTLDLARQLFAKALETPEGLKVQTIHAFCERILSRFPIEAGIMPGFEPMDEDRQRELRAEVKDKVLVEAAGLRSGNLSSALAILSTARADATLNELLGWVSASPEKINLWQKTGGTDDLAAHLGLENRPTPEDVVITAWTNFPNSFLEFIKDGLSGTSNKTEQGIVAIIEVALNSDSPKSGFKALLGLYFTLKGVLRARFHVKGTPDHIKNAIENLGDIIIAAETTRRSAIVLQMSEAVYQIATHFTTLYKDRKHQLRLLDFSDQILLVRNLLIAPGVSDWIKYKLDGGIEHILLDEAQDTSPEQWQIIDTLAEPFFQESPDRDSPNPRTLFAVGDEKQSIYSFQGAEPQQFLDRIRHYTRLTKMGEVRMRMSFRSTQQVLDVVDTVFDDLKAGQLMFPQDYPPGSDIATHVARRDDMGCAEFWPIIPKPEKAEEREPWDTTPVDAYGESDQRVRLAKQIAKTIRHWIEVGETVFDRDTKKLRPIHAGDVMILVQRRNSFFDAIIQQLKAEGLAVAGADRLKLKDAIIVKDMLSLARFVLLPSDDLSLAEVLKSPLFGFDDEALFEVAVQRKGSLWQALQERRADIAEPLSDILKDGQTLLPFEFFAKTLGRLDESGHSAKQKYFRRLGMESREALEAFLSRALDLQYRRAPNLQHFVRDFADNDIEIKRDMDLAGGQIRVMTVHGAKGLEAPIVFLPDTTAVPSERGNMVAMQDSFIWSPPKAQRPDLLAEVYQAARDKTLQEQLRLLYVAMTRAESRLIICGYHNGSSKEGYSDNDDKTDEEKRSWYAWAKAAFEYMGGQPFTIAEAEDGVNEGLRIGQRPEPIQSAANDCGGIATSLADLPDWARRMAPDAISNQRLSPSSLLEHDLSAKPSLTSARREAMQRGGIIHRLLEILPDYPQDKHNKIADQILAGQTDLREEMREEIKAEVLAVLADPDFAQIFTFGSQAEVALTGSLPDLPEALWMNAQIDRLCVTPNKVLIIDYKSDRAPPSNAVEIAETYVLQMTSYRALAQQVYPGREVACGLLWTQTPQLMWLDAAQLDQALKNFAALPKSGLNN